MSKSINLVKYAGDFWVTLADFSLTRDTEGYSGEASVKAAIRTFVVKQDPDKYIAFRGEVQLKNIIKENKNNPLFHTEAFQGTRTALIMFDMVKLLCERFKVNNEYAAVFRKFITEAEDYIEKTKTTDTEIDTATNPMLEGRSSMLRQLRHEKSRIEKEIEIRQNNLEKIMQAINALESLEVEEAE